MRSKREHARVDTTVKDARGGTVFGPDGKPLKAWTSSLAKAGRQRIASGASRLRPVIEDAARHGGKIPQFGFGFGAELVGIGEHLVALGLGGCERLLQVLSGLVNVAGRGGMVLLLAVVRDDGCAPGSGWSGLGGPGAVG